MTVVAISAAYGARGGLVGPELAQRLGVPFVDRLITHRVAGALGVSLEEAHHHWEPPNQSFLERVLSRFGGVDTGVPVGPPPPENSAEDFRRAAETVVLEQAASGEGVILGRGAVAALREHPHVLRVRLAGPRQARLRIATELSDLDRDHAAAALRHLDRYHREYMREFYDRDVEDPDLYHLVIDATAIDVSQCVGLIALAAEAIR